MDFKNKRKIINRKKRRQILRKYPTLQKLKKCISKTQFKLILLNLSPDWKKFLRFYMKDCFIFHLFVRQIKDNKLLMLYRQVLFDALDHPELITKELPFTSNLIKNFSKGILNFVVMFYEDLLKEELIPKKSKKCSFKIRTPKLLIK